MRMRQITSVFVCGIAAVTLFSSCGGSGADEEMDKPTATTAALLTKNGVPPANSTPPKPTPGKGKGKATVNMPMSGG